VPTAGGVGLVAALDVTVDVGVEVLGDVPTVDVAVAQVPSQGVGVDVAVAVAVAVDVTVLVGAPGCRFTVMLASPHVRVMAPVGNLHRPMFEPDSPITVTSLRARDVVPAAKPE
jgi:hypothetical protein